MDEKNGNHRRHPLCGVELRDIDRSFRYRTAQLPGWIFDRSGKIFRINITGEIRRRYGMILSSCRKRSDEPDD